GRLKLHNAINIRKIMTRRKPEGYGYSGVLVGEWVPG
ncbi:hypothetical protein PC128_g26389, partial [Phytophthora cactorum]